MLVVCAMPEVVPVPVIYPRSEQISGEHDISITLNGADPSDTAFDVWFTVSETQFLFLLSALSRKTRKDECCWSMMTHTTVPPSVYALMGAFQ